MKYNLSKFLTFTNRLHLCGGCLDPDWIPKKRFTAGPNSKTQSWMIPLNTAEPVKEENVFCICFDDML